MYLGEIISLGVAMSWTITAIVSEVATKHMGVLVTNVWRMLFAMICSALLMWAFTGDFLPVYADSRTWMWMLLSGFVGYFFGDWCLFNSYLTIGSRFGQLFMTLAPIASAISAWVMLGQVMSWMAVVAMLVTLSGIAISVLGRTESGHGVKLQLPWKGVLFGIGAGVGQGLGLVLSKVGMDAYAEALPSDRYDEIMPYIAFSANQIRCIAGLVCFFLWLAFKKEIPQLPRLFHDGKAALMLCLAVTFGPFLGVAFSLIAVQYTAAGIASTLMAITPILILVPSYYIFHQPITLKGVIGAIISVVGVSLFFV